MEIQPSTHVKMTLSAMASGLVGVAIAIWGAATWAGDARDANEMAGEAIQLAKQNSMAIASLAQTTALQSQVQSQQQQQINDLIQLQRKVSDSVIRIETKLEREDR
jgi:hypothetical protein